MNISNYVNYGMCIYPQAAKETFGYKLGDVVKKDNEIGVIIQIHEDGDFRTDMFGNASASEVTLATDREIKKYRPDILNEGTFFHRVFNTMTNIGSSKYVVNYHDGRKTHTDNSPFFDIYICNSKRELNAFIKKLKANGYREE